MTTPSVFLFSESSAIVGRFILSLVLRSCPLVAAKKKAQPFRDLERRGDLITHQQRNRDCDYISDNVLAINWTIYTLIPPHSVTRRPHSSSLNRLDNGKVIDVR